MTDELNIVLRRCAELSALARHLAATATMASATDYSSGDGASGTEALDGELQRVLSELDAVRARVDNHIIDRQRQQVAEALRRDAAVRLNIGPGATLLAGWVNVDLFHGDVIADLRRPLPFPDNCASHVYGSHVLEHLRNPDESYAFLRECRRVLRRGGKLRVVVPDIGEYLRAAIEPDGGFWETHQQVWPWSRIDANRLDQTLQYAGAGARPDDFFGHQHGYNADSLLDTLQQAGFAPVKLCAFQQSSDEHFRIDDQSAVAHVQHDGRAFSLFAEGFSLF